MFLHQIQLSHLFPRCLFQAWEIVRLQLRQTIDQALREGKKKAMLVSSSRILIELGRGWMKGETPSSTKMFAD